MFEHLVQLLGTYAVALIISGLVRLIWGANYRTMPEPSLFSGSVQLFGYSYARYNLFMIVAALVIGAAVYLMLYRTSLGRNIRAAVADSQLLSTTGVNVKQLFTTVFMIGAGLAGLGGVIVAPSPICTSKACSGAAPARAPCFQRLFRKFDIMLLMVIQVPPSLGSNT